MIERVRLSSASSLIGQSPVRGRPFKHGNPGRPPGSKNKTTKMVEELVDGNAEKITQKLIELGLAGNVRCLQYCLDRLLPQRRGRPLDLQLPTINGVHDIAPVMASITNELNSGNLTPEEASQVIGLLESYARVITTKDLAIRLEQLELRLKQMKSLKG